MAPSPIDFDGKTYDPAKDKKRLTGQLAYVQFIMSDRKWRTLGEIADIIKNNYDKIASEAAISARLRDLRKAKFGKYEVDRRRRSKGLFEYRVMSPEAKTLFN